VNIAVQDYYTREHSPLKCIIQIPCLNEAGSIEQTLKDLPREIPGVDVIETLIIDDGSTDDTIAVARAHGATHVLSFTCNQGLARAFRAGIEEALRLGADIIVNTDGDNQYAGECVPALVEPIVARRAEFVIGVRDVWSIKHFSARKKLLQWLGSWVVRQLSGTKVRDVTSGFRAFSRESAMQLDLVTDYTHTIETLIALGKERGVIAQVDVRTNHKNRESRLMRSMVGYIARCAADMIRIYVRYESLKTFGGTGFLFMAAGLLSGAFYVFNRVVYDGRSMVMLALFSLLMVSGMLFITLGFLGDSIACNRRMISRITRYVREQRKWDHGAGDPARSTEEQA